MSADAVPTTGTPIPLDGPTRAFTQGVADGSDLAEAIPNDRDAWLFFAGRAFALRYGQDQESAEAQAYVQGINLRKPEAPQAADPDERAARIGRALTSWGPSAVEAALDAFYDDDEP